MNPHHLHSYYKLKALLPEAQPQSRGALVLSFHDKVIAGALSNPSIADSKTSIEFRDQGFPVDDLKQAFEIFTERYHCNALAAISRQNLLKTLDNFVQQQGIDGESYSAQLIRLRRELGLSAEGRSSSVQSVPVRSLAKFFPSGNFLLQLFTGWFAELLPEQKLLLLGIVDENNTDFQSVLLKFTGSECVAAYEPDYAGFDWKELVTNFFDPISANRFVAWSEHQFNLPTYTLFVTKKLWQNSCKTQSEKGARAAWKILTQSKEARKQVLFEPQPWPISVLLHWHRLKG